MGARISVKVNQRTAGKDGWYKLVARVSDPNDQQEGLGKIRVRILHTNMMVCTLKFVEVTYRNISPHP